MTDPWTDRLSELVDGDLDAATAAAAEAHLTECAACAGIVADLRAVARRAQELRDREPVRDLWPGIAARVERHDAVTSLSRWKRLRKRRVVFSVPQLAAAGVALLAVSAGTVWLAIGGGGAPSPVPGTAPAVVVSAPPSLTLAGYEPAVRELELVLAEHRDRLDTATVRVIEASLATIDRAIA
jgi:anti-sigma factor RsiW